MKKIYNGIRNLSLFKKLIILFATFILCIIVAVTIIANIHKSDTNNNKASEVTEEKLSELTLKETVSSLEVGTNFNLNVIAKSNIDTDFIYSSSNEAILIVDENGCITAVAPGIATITIRDNISNLSTFLLINVTAKEISADLVTLTTTNITLKVSDNHTITPTISPEDSTTTTFIYTSSDTNIATVSADGNVTAISPGECTIDVIANDSNKAKVTLSVVVESLQEDTPLNDNSEQTNTNTNTNSNSTNTTNNSSNNNSNSSNNNNASSSNNSAPSTPSESTTPSFSSEAEAVLYYVNIERNNNGLSSLTLSSSITNAANARAIETVSLFSHTRPNGETCFTVLDEYGIGYNSCGENIAYGYSDAKSVVTAWMNSEGHRANILSSSFNQLGVGCYYDSNTGSYYWVQLFTN